MQYRIQCSSWFEGYKEALGAQVSILPASASDIRTVKLGPNLATAVFIAHSAFTLPGRLLYTSSPG